jgi:ribosome maturation protein SDO1
MSYEDIIKLILDKGEIQVSDKERESNIKNTKNMVTNIIVEKTYNKDTGLPFPQSVITKVLDDYKFTINEDKDAKKQALKAIKFIQDQNILAIERNLMQILIRFKAKYYNDETTFKQVSEKLLDFLKETSSQILETNTIDAKQFKVKCNIYPNHYREILTDYQESNYILTTALSIEILSSSVNMKPDDTTIKNNINTAKYFDYMQEEEVNTRKEKTMEQTLSGLKIADQRVEQYLNDNYKDDEQFKVKKIISCTKCKDSKFETQDELRKHFKTNWHCFNAKISAQNKEPLSAEEYDDYILMNPNIL